MSACVDHNKNNNKKSQFTFTRHKQFNFIGANFQADRCLYIIVCPYMLKKIYFADFKGVELNTAVHLGVIGTESFSKLDKAQCTVTCVVQIITQTCIIDGAHRFTLKQVFLKKPYFSVISSSAVLFFIKA